MQDKASVEHMKTVLDEELKEIFRDITVSGRDNWCFDQLKVASYWDWTGSKHAPVHE